MPNAATYRMKATTNVSLDVVNAIRHDASTNYRNYVPIATPDADSCRAIGTIMMDNPAIRNEFIDALVNRIALTISMNKVYRNPWGVFKKGFLEFGETVEEIFTNIAKPFQYNAETAETEVFKREIPDVRVAFHIMNYKTFYKVTIQHYDLKQAFLSWGAVDDFIAKVVESMSTGEAYDEFNVMKYMFAHALLNGRMYPVQTDATGTKKEFADNLLESAKGSSNMIEFMSEDYNAAGVKTFTDKQNQYLIMSAKNDAAVDVYSLAAAFNMDKAEFMGHKILIDSFSSLDTARLGILFANDTTYEEISESDLKKLDDTVAGVLVDESFWQVYDNLREMAEQYNGQALYWNYFLHSWKTFGVSPFANAIVFTKEAPAVSAITVTPAAATFTRAQITQDNTLQLTPTVNTKGFAPKTVDYISDSEYVTVSPSGLVTIKKNPPSSLTKANITVRSTYDSTKTATAALTFA